MKVYELMQELAEIPSGYDVAIEISKKELHVREDLSGSRIFRMASDCACSDEDSLAILYT